MIRFFAVVNYMVRKCSFCSNFYADVLANIYILHIFIDLKTFFISWNIILKLKSFIQIGTFILFKKFLTPRVYVNFFDETRKSTSIYHLGTPLLRYDAQKYSLGESILFAKTKEYTLLYIPDKFQGIWMTKHFCRSVFYRSLKDLICILFNLFRRTSTSSVTKLPWTTWTAVDCPTSACRRSLRRKPSSTWTLACRQREKTTKPNTAYSTSVYRKDDSAWLNLTWGSNRAVFRFSLLVIQFLHAMPIWKCITGQIFIPL